MHHSESPARAAERIGAIDVGSNALRMTAAEIGPSDHIRRVASDRAAVRLGAALSHEDGCLAPEALDAAVLALASFRARLDALEVRRVRAVATSAVRESTSAAELAERARAEAGVDLEVISGAEEARLVYVAVRAAVPLGSRPWVLVDVGGGSVEVSLVDARGIRESESHRFGAVRLLEEADGETERLDALIDAKVARLRVPELARAEDVAGLIGVGGNIEALAKLAKGGRDEPPGTRHISLPQLRSTLTLLAPLTSAERVARFELRADRADVIVPAGRVYERIAVRCGAAEVVVPGVGLRDGLLRELAAQVGPRAR